MPSEKTNLGVYKDVRREKYQDTTLKNAKEEDSEISNLNQKSWPRRLCLALYYSIIIITI